MQNTVTHQRFKKHQHLALRINGQTSAHSQTALPHRAGLSLFYLQVNPLRRRANEAPVLRQTCSPARGKYGYTKERRIWPSILAREQQSGEIRTEAWEPSRGEPTRGQQGNITVGRPWGGCGLQLPVLSNSTVLVSLCPEESISTEGDSFQSPGR